MGQHDFEITNADANTGLSVRAALNAALQALASVSSGVSAPGTTYPCQFWADTTNNLLKMRNVANTAWITLGTLDAAYLALLTLASAQTITAQHTFNPGSASAPFILGANALNQLVTGLNADKTDSLHANEIPKIKSGSFSRDSTTASGSQAVTGVGFLPRLLLFMAAAGYGKEFSTGHDRAITPLSFAYYINTDKWMVSTSHSIRYIIDGTTTKYEGLIASLDADGFTITWTKTGSPTGTISIVYLALG